MAAAGRILTRTAALLKEGKIRPASSSESIGEGQDLENTGDLPGSATSKARGVRIRKN
jgi:hypothetical protein